VIKLQKTVVFELSCDNDRFGTMLMVKGEITFQEQFLAILCLMLGAVGLGSWSSALPYRGY
jgi:hypothetical protein